MRPLAELDTTSSEAVRLFARKRAASGGLLFRSGEFEVRLASRKKHIRKAQRLRYIVFFEEGRAIADRTAALIRRDVCRFDRFCDHLLVIDHAARNRFGRRKPKVVGTYRLLRGDVAARNCGFYSAQEFDIEPLLARHPGKRFLELGRSCVAPAYRTRHTLDLLWRGIALYIAHHRIDVLIGSASLPGTRVAEHDAALRFLTQHYRAPPEWRALPRSTHVASLATLTAPSDNRRTLPALPPLIKGYLRCGALFSDGFFVDRRFGTIDLFAVMPVDRIAPRYLARFAPDATAVA